MAKFFQKLRATKLNEAQENEKNENIERMKQGPAENMAIAVLKQLLKDTRKIASNTDKRIANEKQWYKKARKVNDGSSMSNRLHQ